MISNKSTITTPFISYFAKLITEMGKSTLVELSPEVFVIMVLPLGS